MVRDEFTALDRIVRSLSASHWRKLAIMRSTARAPWLNKEIGRLYEATTPLHIETLPDAEAAQWLDALLVLEAQLRKVEQAIPFENKLRPMMRPFRQRFQDLIRLRNATHCGIAALRQRLHRTRATSHEPWMLNTTDKLRAQDLIASRAPGWLAPEMEIYDHL